MMTRARREIAGPSPIVANGADKMESFEHSLQEIHIATLNLATTYGLFHGMNDAFKAGKISERRPSHAIAIVQSE